MKDGWTRAEEGKNSISVYFKMKDADKSSELHRHASLLSRRHFPNYQCTKSGNHLTNSTIDRVWKVFLLSLVANNLKISSWWLNTLWLTHTTSHSGGYSLEMMEAAMKKVWKWKRNETQARRVQPPRGIIILSQAEEGVEKESILA